jgi:hypothetical protein
MLVLLLIAHTNRFFYPLLTLGRIDSLLFRTGVLATQDCKALIPVANIGLKPEVAASLLMQGERCSTFLLGEFRRLLDGDRFYTGPGTRMKIDFWNGAYVELDENTDPSLFQDLNCPVVSLFRSGRIFVDKADACVESLAACRAYVVESENRPQRRLVFDDFAVQYLDIWQESGEK